MRRACASTILLAALTGGCEFNVGTLDPQDLAGVDIAGADLAGADLTGGDDGPPPDMTVGPDMVVVPLLQVTRADLMGNTNLTTEGTLDWMHFGLNVPSDVNRKTGANLLGELSTGTLTQYTQYQPSWSWSDGTPTANVSNTKTGTYVFGNGKGFTITAPTAATTRTLRVYASHYNTTGTFVAHLSDGSLADVVNMHTAGGVDTPQLWTVTFRATPGTTLTCTWLGDNDSGVVDVMALTLQ